jgi:hypothetical protein
VCTWNYVGDFFLVTINALYTEALRIPWFYDSANCKYCSSTLPNGIKLQAVLCILFVLLPVCRAIFICVYNCYVVCANMNNCVHIVKVQKGFLRNCKMIAGICILFVAIRTRLLYDKLAKYWANNVFLSEFLTSNSIMGGYDNLELLF